MAWGFGNSGAASGGGFNRHDALLRVQALAGSLVTITKGQYHKSDLGHENAQDHTVYDYYFIIHQSQFDSVNSWTVTAALNGEVSINTIIIDSADEYDLVFTTYLPIEYQAVSYIDLHTSAILTGVVPTNHYSQFFIYIYNRTNGNGVIGTDRAQSHLYYSLCGYNGAWYMGYNGTEGSGGTTAIGDWEIQFNYGSSNQVITNGTVISSGHTFSSNVQLNIGSRGLPNGTNGFAAAGTRWKRFIIYEKSNNEKVRDFYPCYRKSDSKAGMWDKVGQTFYPYTAVDAVGYAELGENVY